MWNMSFFLKKTTVKQTASRLILPAPFGTLEGKECL
jgi:hypothetical protein